MILHVSCRQSFAASRACGDGSSIGRTDAGSRGVIDFLDRFEPDILADDLRRDQDDRGAVAVGFVEAVDEVQTAGTATSSAGREAAGEQRFSLGGESACLLVPHVDPVDLAAIDRVRDPVQRVADDPIASPHARSFQRFDQ